MEPMDLIVYDIKRLMMSVEIFLKGISDSYENIDTKIAYVTYKRAYNKQDRFETYRTYDPELLVEWGITENIVIAHQWGEDPSLIPSSLRGLVLINQRNHVVRTYVEGNEYIRIRLGLPTLAEMEKEDFVYASEKFYTKYRTGNKPLHLFSDVDFVRLKNTGEYNKILALYPEKKYLKYIGLNKLNHFVLKEAKNFDLISYDTTLDDRLLNDFLTIFAQMRHYTVNVLYVKEFSKQYEHYDSYMSLIMIVMTIQRLIANVFKNGIDRDYYDLFNLQMLFESHNTPFLKEMPMEYQRVLARNLNRLLRMKSTDQVLYDVAELLGFERSDFFKYYLVKQHRLDENGNPLIIYKTAINEDTGQEETVLDYERMYDLYFQGVNFNEDDIASALDDVANRISYEDMVIHDDFWWEDDKELNKVLYQTEYNIIETKYFGVQSMYRITEMVHEVARFFRMIIDNKDTTRDIYISLPKISSDKKLTLFETIVFAICLVCKRNKARGEIISTPSKTLGVIGFNFRADFDLIREHLEKNRKYIESDKIAQYILDLEVFTLQDINRVYGNIKELWEFLVDKMSRSTTIEEYEAYDKLYKALIYTDDMAEIFMLPDGTIAETYFDYLNHLNAELYVKIETATETQVFEMLEHIIYSLEDDLDNLEYLSFLIDNDGIMENAFRKFILFLKSYTIDLKDMSIIYLFDNRKYNMIKLIDQIDKFDAEITTGSNGKLEDLIKLLGQITHKEELGLKEDYAFFSTILLESLYKLKTKVSLEVMMYLTTKFNFEDIFMLTSEITHKENIKLDEDFNFIVDMRLSDDYKFRYDVTVMQVNTIATKMGITDFPMINSNILSKSDIKMGTSLLVLISYLIDEKIKLEGKTKVEALIETASIVKLISDAKIGTDIYGRDAIDLSMTCVQINDIQLRQDKILKEIMESKSDMSLATKSLFNIDARTNSEILEADGIVLGTDRTIGSVIKNSIDLLAKRNKFDFNSEVIINTHTNILDFMSNINSIITTITNDIIKENISQSQATVFEEYRMSMRNTTNSNSLMQLSNKWGVDSILGPVNKIATVNTSAKLKDSVVIKHEE